MVKRRRKTAKLHAKHRKHHAGGHRRRGPLSPAHKKAISRALKGRRLSPAHKKAISHSLKGKHRRGGSHKRRKGGGAHRRRRA